MRRRRRYPSPSDVATPVRRAKRIAAGLVDAFILVPFVGLVVAVSTSRDDWAIVRGLALLAIVVGYQTLATAWWSRTLGQWLVGIRVVRIGTFEPLGLRLAFRRALLMSREIDNDLVTGTIVVDDRVWRTWRARPHVER